MAEYREIQGAAVQSLASNTGTIEGQIWYDNVNGAFKLETFIAAGSFASGGTYPVTGRQIAQATTSATNGLAFGGVNAVPGTGRTNASNSYDGTSWTSNPTVPQEQQDQILIHLLELLIMPILGMDQLGQVQTQ
jgi:hypothetical protein